MKSIKNIGLLIVTGMLAVATFGCSGGGEAPASPAPSGAPATPAASATP